jgi:hypothetical protein
VRLETQWRSSCAVVAVGAMGALHARHRIRLPQPSASHVLETTQGLSSPTDPAESSQL